MKKSLIVVLMFVGLVIILGSDFASANVCDGGAIDCTDGGDKKCLEECENWVLGDKKNDDYYMGACGMWRCASKKLMYIGVVEDDCNWMSYGGISKRDYNDPVYDSATSSCVFESKKKSCAKTKDCPDKFVCDSSGNCDCKNGAIVKDGFFQSCCGENEKAFFGTKSYSPFMVTLNPLWNHATSICCSQNVNAVVLKEELYSDKPKGEYPLKCCAPEEHNSYDALAYTQQCCPKEQEWSISKGEEGGCVARCCRDDNDCSTFCEDIGTMEIMRSVYIEKEICKKPDFSNKGYCIVDPHSRLSGAKDVYLDNTQKCITEEAIRGEEGFVPDNPCGSKKVATIVCRGNEFCSSFCNGETSDADGNKLDMIDKSVCSNGAGNKGKCIPKSKETCEKGKVCVEHIKPGNNLVVTAKCEDCPNTASFAGDREVPGEFHDDTDIIIGDNSRKLKKENSFVTLTPEEFFNRLANLCDKCPAKKSGKKLDMVFLDSHGNSDGPIFKNEFGKKEQLTASKTREILTKDNNKLLNKLKNCMKEFVIGGCDVGAGLVDDVLAKELNTKVTAGRTPNTGFYRCSSQRSYINIPDPIVTKPGKGKKGFIKTIYYLTKPNNLYPGFGGEVYQAEVVNGTLGEVDIQIESYDNDVLFAEMSEETMPCKSTIIDEELFAIAPNTGKTEFYNFSIKVLPGTFLQRTDSAVILVRKLSVDCSFYEEIYNNKIELLTQSQMDEVKELYLENYSSKEYYDDFKYRFENKLECTKDEHCLGLRCSMSDLNCNYVCKRGKCERKAGNEVNVGVGADANNDGLISLLELTGHIQKWINGEVALSGLTNAIQGWISGGTSTSSGNNASGSGRPSDKPENGLVGYWNFDEGSGRVAYDVSGNKNDGVITDAGFVSGKAGKALEFNGSGIVSIPHSDKFNFGVGQFTLIAWIKMYSPALNAPQHIIGKRDNTGGGNWVRLLANNGYLIAEYSPGMQESSQSPHADGEWHQIALVKENNENAFFYFDRGAMVISIPTDVSNIGEFTIGKWDGESSFKGVIDEVRVYNRALGQDEIINRV